MDNQSTVIQYREEYALMSPAGVIVLYKVLPGYIFKKESHIERQYYRWGKWGRWRKTSIEGFNALGLSMIGEL